MGVVMGVVMGGVVIGELVMGGGLVPYGGGGSDGG